MSTEQNIIKRIKNTSKKDMRFIFPQFNYDFELKAGESTEEYPMELPPPGAENAIEFVMAVASGGLLPRRTVFLHYEITDDSKYEFRYKVPSYSEEEFLAEDPTNPDAHVHLDLWYMGNGVVIVGTGDM
jgi:hypothetical protein